MRLATKVWSLFLYSGSGI